MKQINASIHTTPLLRKLNVYLAATAAVAVLALALPSLLGRAIASADEDRGDGQEWASSIHAAAQVAALDQLLADFHGALSYGGNLTGMMSLWAEDSSITLNGTTHIGKAAVQAFFTSGGYFHHNWVSLAPEYKTQITLHGHTAEATTQCVAIDVDPKSPTFHQVMGVIQVNATAVRHEGKWLYTSMNNTTPAPL